jgi:hypothetical protein
MILHFTFVFPLFRCLAMTGLICAALDKDRKLTDLSRRDNLKSKLARNETSLIFLLF